MQNGLLWRDSPPLLRLAEGEVHIWRVSLDLSEAGLLRRQAWLSADELARAQRLRFAEQRRRFIAGRGVLRELLGGYSGLAAGDLRFECNAHGKPALDASLGCGIQFNLAHSGDLALYAFALDVALGIDVEGVRPLADAGGLAARYFSPQEGAVLAVLPQAVQPRAFLHCWTCKEAYLKGRGEGLRAPLKAFDVAFPPLGAAKLVCDRRDPEAVARWFLHTLPLTPDFVGTLAVERAAALRFYRLDERG